MNQPDALPRNERWSLYASHAIVVLMMACFATAGIWLAEWLFPKWDPRGMIVACLVVILEAIFSYRLIKYLPTMYKRAGYYRVTEWISILVILKVFTELRAGPGYLINNIAHWPQNFLFYFFTGDYLLNCVLIFAVWQISTVFTADLQRLELDPALQGNLPGEWKPVRETVLRRFLSVGVAITLFTGITLQDTFTLNRPITAHNAIPLVIIYFLLGLVLLSLTRFTALQAMWNRERVGVQKNITERWILSSVLFLGILTALAVWLPTNYSLGFFATIRYVMTFFFLLLQAAFAFVVFFISYLYSSLSRLFGLSRASTIVEPAAQTEPLLRATTSVTGSDVVKSVFFWTFFVILIIVALRQYLLAHQEMLEELNHLAPWRWLSKVWQRLRAGVKKANNRVANLVQAGIRRLRTMRTSSRTGEEWSSINTWRLSPRQKILAYYLTLVKQAEEVGTSRLAGQTPYEYSEFLTTHLIGEKESVDEMTESFVEARYSRHEFTKETASRIRLDWERVKRVLQYWRKSRRRARRNQ